MEAILREFKTPNKGYVIEGEKIEEAYALCEELIAKFVQEYNSEEDDNTGKSRLELFNDRYGACRIKPSRSALQVLSKSHLCTGKRIGQVEILLPSNKKVLVHNEYIVVGQQYQVLQIRGNEETFFVFALDGKSLGKGTILRPGSEERIKEECASRHLFAKIRAQEAARRTRGAIRNLEHYADQPLPVEGARSVIRNEATQEKAQPSKRKRKPEAVEKEPTSIAAQALPEPVPAPKKYTREALGAFDL